ncbi:MAG: hypothetical protein ABW164_03055 [Sphingobium sp.]
MPEEKDQPPVAPDHAPEGQAENGKEDKDEASRGDVNPLAPPVNIGAGS